MSTIRSLSRFFALMALLCLSACLAGCALPGLGSDKPQRTPGLSPGPCVVLVLPNTGGTGTLLFTIGGIALIAGAAVLFVIYRKKSSSK